jgi:K+-sensing histidine kinase KdpD
MGLGLSICHRLIETFGGTIRAANHTDGHSGAIITVMVPIHLRERV